MTDALRNERFPAGGDLSDRDRDARVEELLLLGLDHYFAGQYELAISVWTRVLFLDRGHARARAYIERARSAASERQREGEELLHTGAAAFDRGDAGAARRLLTSAVERGAASEEALSLLDRLNRLELIKINSPRPMPRRVTRTVEPDVGVPEPGDRQPSRFVWIASGALAGLAIAAAAAWLWTGGDWRPQNRSEPSVVTAPAPLEPLVVPAASKVSLLRARAFLASGRLHDALKALENIREGDPIGAEADALRADIQRQLLAAARAGKRPITPPPEGTSRP
ncbi:MAG TPA: hypothetical protein VLD67_08525 [Vicinamibacterales bacterium]|nr:hypothetical protein [Vicinamibacterales bacterium]